MTIPLERMVDCWALPDGAAERLQALLDLIAVDPHVPTTVRDPAQALDIHIADSLVALELHEVRQAAVIADIGSGAGFPGLPLAVALPEADAALVESATRKCSFLARAVAACGVTNATVVHARAEEWEAGMARNDLVAVRAVAPLSVLVEYAAPLLREGGSLVAWKGRRDEAEERGGAAAATSIGMEPSAIHAVKPFSTADERHLHVFTKIAPTPSGFPRRPGMARKRPLG